MVDTIFFEYYQTSFNKLDIISEKNDYNSLYTRIPSHQLSWQKIRYYILAKNKAWTRQYLLPIPSKIKLRIILT
jgi:hypothetical protein